MRYISFLFLYMRKAKRRVQIYLFRPLFKKYGKNFVFDPNGYYSYRTIEVGDDVFIGLGACLSAPNSKIVIGNKVMLGPNVIVSGGDHNISVVGKFMFDVKEKDPSNDLPVIIEDDVWIGAGAIILKGVTIKKGSVVAAGSIVVKDVPEFTIVGGVPARVIKNRFSAEHLEIHKSKLTYN